MNDLDCYKTLLDYVMPVIESKFESQKEYISCSKGCALCCKNVKMPFCEIEFKYILEGLNLLSSEKQQIIKNNIKNIIENYSENNVYDCPFLIDNICSVYDYRAIICRTFGLLMYTHDGDYTIPFCVHDGLNYSKIFDESTQKISVEKYNNLGFKNPPVYCSLTRQNIFNISYVKESGMNVGESKPLLEWLKLYFS